MNLKTAEKIIDELTKDKKKLRTKELTIDEDYCEPVTVSMLPDEDEVFENEIDSELVAIPVDSFELVNTLIAYGLIEKGPEIVNFFEGVYFYKPTQELLSYMDELKEKYNK